MLILNKKNNTIKHYLHFFIKANKLNKNLIKIILLKKTHKPQINILLKKKINLNIIYIFFKKNQKPWVFFKNIVLGPYQILFLNDLFEKALRKELMVIKFLSQILNKMFFKKWFYFNEHNLRTRILIKKLKKIQWIFLKITWNSVFFKKKRIKKWLQKKYTTNLWR